MRWEIEKVRNRNFLWSRWDFCPFTSKFGLERALPRAVLPNIDIQSNLTHKKKFNYIQPWINGPVFRAIYIWYAKFKDRWEYIVLCLWVGVWLAKSRELHSLQKGTQISGPPSRAIAPILLTHGKHIAQAMHAILQKLMSNMTQSPHQRTTYPKQYCSRGLKHHK